MKPFTKALYSAYAGKENTRVFSMPPEARLSVCLFRVMLSLTAVREQEFTRPLASYSTTTHVPWIIEFDASLSGVGILWFYRATSESKEVLLGGCSLDITSLDFGVDASHQNTAEFLAATLGIRGLMAFEGFSASSKSIEMRGDSVTALDWSIKRKAKSVLATNASIFYALQCMGLGVEVTTVTHLSAAQNWKADMLSRG
jgi:hypothetical protein